MGFMNKETKKKALKEYEKMKASLSKAVFKEVMSQVGQKLLDNEKEAEKRLFAKLENWEKEVREIAKKIVKEELEKQKG